MSDGRAGQAVPLEDVEEHLEQARCTSALKIGVAAIRPSAARTASIAACSCGLGKPVSRWFVRSWA